MKRCNKAFTLTELLVALGVIAVLCAILLPVIFNILPNRVFHRVIQLKGVGINARLWGFKWLFTACHVFSVFVFSHYI